MASERFLANKRLNIEEIRKRETVLKSRFTSLICTLENRCNIQCVMCGVWRQPWSIPERTFREIMDSLQYLEHVIWLGGEVFLSPYFSEILEETRKYPYLEQRVNTNALLIDEKWAERLVASNVELICSIDAATPATYEHIRRGGKFKDLMRALEAISAARKNNPGKRFRIRMNTVVMRSNYQELDPVLELAHTYGFENLQLIGIQGDDGPETIFTDTPENRKISQELEKTLERLGPKAREYGIDLLPCLPLHRTGCAVPCETKSEMPRQEKVEPVARQDEAFCYLPWQQMLIEPFGHTRFGCWCREPIGNVEKNGLLEMWNSPAARKYRALIAGNAYHDYCDARCVHGEIPSQLRMVNEFQKHHADELR